VHLDLVAFWQGWVANQVRVMLEALKLLSVSVAIRHTFLMDGVSHYLELSKCLVTQLQSLKALHILRLPPLEVHFLLLWWQNGLLSPDAAFKWHRILKVLLQKCRLKYVLEWTLIFRILFAVVLKIVSGACCGKSVRWCP
jgi:hypothetical protein